MVNRTSCCLALSLLLGVLYGRGGGLWAAAGMALFLAFLLQAVWRRCKKRAWLAALLRGAAGCSGRHAAQDAQKAASPGDYARFVYGNAPGRLFLLAGFVDQPDVVCGSGQSRGVRLEQHVRAEGRCGAMIYWDLFFGFLRVGCFAFGGAYGAIPLIREVALSYGWLDDEAISYMIAVSESTPGPIMINLATYVGSSQAGLWGAVLATLAVVLPSFLIILLVMAVLKTLFQNSRIQAVVRGLKPCVVGIILATGVSMTVSSCLGQEGSPDLRACLITAVLAAVMIGFRQLRGSRLSPILLILLSAVLGLAAYGGGIP